MEKAAQGARYNVIGDEGITIKEIAGIIGKQLNLPVETIGADKAAEHFTWMSRFIVFDNPATSYITQEELSWKPTHIGLKEDMQQHYF